MTKPGYRHDIENNHPGERTRYKIYIQNLIRILISSSNKWIMPKAL